MLTRISPIWGSLLDTTPYMDFRKPLLETDLWYVKNRLSIDTNGVFSLYKNIIFRRPCWINPINVVWHLSLCCFHLLIKYFPFLQMTNSLFVSRSVCVCERKFSWPVCLSLLWLTSLSLAGLNLTYCLHRTWDSVCPEFVRSEWHNMSEGENLYIFTHHLSQK